MENILPSTVLCLTEFHSWLLFTLKHSFKLTLYISLLFMQKNVSIFITFLSVSLPKVGQPLPLCPSISIMLCHSISLPFFFPLWFFSGRHGLQWKFTDAGKDDRTKQKLFSVLPPLLFMFQECSVICPSARPVNLFQGLTYVSCSEMWISISG